MSIFGSVFFGIFVFLLFLILSVTSFIGAFIYYRSSNLVSDIPTSNIRSASMGLSEIIGKLYSRNNNYVKHPFTNDECLYYSMKVSVDTEEHHWKLKEETDYTEMVIKDKTGEVPVNLESNPNIYGFSEQDAKYVDSLEKFDIPWYHKIYGKIIFLLSLSSKSYKVTVSSIYPDSNYYILGELKKNNKNNTYLGEPNGRIPMVIFTSNCENEVSKALSYLALFFLITGIVSAVFSFYLLISVVLG